MIFAFPIVIAEKWERKFPALQYLVCPGRALFVGTRVLILSSMFTKFVDWSLVFCIMFYGSLFVMLWYLPLFSLSFDLRLLITPLVSLNYCHLNVMFSVEENKQRAFPIVIAEKWERKFPALQYLVCPGRALFVGTRVLILSSMFTKFDLN
jgi:hypothetical protein